MVKNYSLILGGYVNGYSIIKELYEKDLRDIALFDYGKSLGSKSNKINYHKSIDKTSNSLKNAILGLKKECDYIVIFPTDDLQLENLHAIYDEIKEFCFVPFNYDNVLQSLDKYVQYSFCEKHDIPYPKTQNIQNVADVQKIESMMFPVLVKPNKLYDSNIGVFRGLLLNDKNEFIKKIDEVKDYISKGVTFLASEFIPGDDTNMYSYNAYRNQKGVILNEWIGKKLTQYPDNFGMFSSASNEAPEIVKVQGRKLLEVIDLKGICEPEFKYDSRDGKYKLMEITHRSTMWHRLGFLSGVDINYTLYLDAIGREATKVQQNINEKVHFIYMKHEILNLLFRKGYWKHFKYNVFGCRNREFAVYNSGDIKPFIYDLFELMKGLVGRCLRVLKLR
jgi:predicted ATP-grasp superfamily ATP-dependent carboligase